MIQSTSEGLFVDRQLIENYRKLVTWKKDEEKTAIIESYRTAAHLSRGPDPGRRAYWIGKTKEIEMTIRGTIQGGSDGCVESEGIKRF